MRRRACISRRVMRAEPVALLVGNEFGLRAHVLGNVAGESDSHIHRLAIWREHDIAGPVPTSDREIGNDNFRAPDASCRRYDKDSARCLWFWQHRPTSDQGRAERGRCRRILEDATAARQKNVAVRRNANDARIPHRSRMARPRHRLEFGISALATTFERLAVDDVSSGTLRSPTVIIRCVGFQSP
jgi:hypothetical protein